MNYKELRQFTFSELNKDRDTNEVIHELLDSGNELKNIKSIIQSFPNKKNFKRYIALKALSSLICIFFCYLFLFGSISTLITSNAIHKLLLVIIFITSQYQIFKDRPTGYDGIIAGIIIIYVTANNIYGLLSSEISFPVIASAILIYASKRILFPYYAFNFKALK